MTMTVTLLAPYQGGRGRVAVYLNDKFAFVLYKGELSKYRLEQGSVVDDELYDRIMQETVFIRARKRGMNLLKTMDRTEADVRRKLLEGGYPEEAADDAIEYLRSYKYLDDMRYAGEYIRFKSSSMSRKQITMKLLEKGVDAGTVEEAFSGYEEESGEDIEETERELIRKLIMKRCPNGVSQLEYTDRQKLYSYLYGKGFPISAIESVYKEIAKG